MNESSDAPRGDWPGDESVRRILTLADPNILRLALHHLTGDPALAAMQVDFSPMWAGALFTYSLASQHHAQVRDCAFDYLKGLQGRQPDIPAMDPQTLRNTMELFGHGPMSDSEFRFGVEEAAFSDFPRGVEWHDKPHQEVLDQLHIVVVGAGISGIAAAVHLQQLGLNYTVIERQSDLGGAWHANKYPDVRVDTTSFIYQYKFEKRYPWSEFFASGAENQNYLKHCADKYQVSDQILFNTEVLGGDWQEDSGQWKLQIRTGAAEPRTLLANFVISASGLFSTPKLPDIPGLEGFAGKVLHTTQWNPDEDLTGKRIAQIGTGASGAQLMSHLAKHADHVSVFQRTANWVLPMEGYRDNVAEDTRWLFEHFPLYWHWYSYGMYFLNAQLEGLQEFDAEWQSKGGLINQRNDELAQNVTAFIRDRLKDRPDLIERVIPRYPPMARRPTVDNGWYDALLRDNVELVTDPIDHATADALVTRDGTLHECDLIVCAAGFQTTRYLWPAHYTGRNGATLDALWAADGPRANLGMTLPGFPNFFLFYGPSSQARSGSFHSMSEQWTRYALKAIVNVIEQGKRSMECTREAYDDYNKRLDEANQQVLWETYGKGFYYLTEQGRSVVNSPWRGTDYHALLFEPDMAEFKLL